MGRASCCGNRKQIKAVLFCWLVGRSSMLLPSALKQQLLLLLVSGQLRSSCQINQSSAYI
ncbi:hypothetical protein BHE74_00009945 [Ensete ventricosum]|uniref:Uncharacterized protein n=1 Tax=Ensete ventricosum TaxID=4639 RepID=A0A426ZI65_ENSVE|nr:hypothetical protein B296_00013086 [Ensete ventricosum]RWW81641.1 hypothetical protein BHE74_00009945 [Ensete ventricosum]